ncbi:oxidoreductase [Actinoplanes lobatus]|uniref:NADH dehydrogenase FAD-containing subunit n=1 Tax=Actinoplanes lobatus TaxID=113568 RepID=A0A7W7HKZ2_9ACTN|nr:FAD-dependent oxidoreductase [Actinoplanes lobatus]MBB4752444.1 NADH dehydrogenase FAD-containing subunit [Actinoplanes lobatus]GGN97754.1 oxidoreductase [Actinoplanes lobatus]GIE45796.1 oxidoreductase [Actinoplanes lobatus]
MNTPHIAVLGAGYTGLATAQLLAKRTGATVTLVNNRDRFVERMRNHQLAGGKQVRHLPLHDLLRGSRIRLIIDQVTRIDLQERQIELAGGVPPIDYDLLVYALGSHADTDAVPGAAEHACSVAVAEQAERLRDQMRTAGTVAVVGAGPTGLETATELAESYPDRTVRLVSRGALGEGLSWHGREYLHRALDRLGIQVWENADVAKVDADGLLLAGGDHIGADAVAWTAGFRVPELAREAGLAVDERGRMVVDGTLRSLSHLEVYGVGDAAAAHNQDGRMLRMGCGPGSLAAACAFHAITARLAGRTPAPLRAKDDALCISLGRRDGILQPTDLDGNPHGKVRTGLPVAMLKNFVLQVTGRYTPRYPNLVVAGARQG